MSTEQEGEKNSPPTNESSAYELVGPSEEEREEALREDFESASDKEILIVLRLVQNEAQKRGLTTSAPVESPPAKPREPDPHYPGFYKPT